MNSSNSDDVEKNEHRKNLNPFATDEDDDSDDGEGDFTIGDLEAEEEGRGHLPAGTSLVGVEESLLHGSEDKNVGILSNDSSTASSSYANPRATFPSLWPFGGIQRGIGESNGWGVGVDGEGYSRSHIRGAKHTDDEQSSDEDSDDGYDSGKFGGDGQGRRRLSSTTEAKRRTSLEDDDEEDEVLVHVAMEAPEEVKAEALGDDEELVEIQHAEMQGVEGEASR
jgi:hypothetical protein